MDQNLNTGPNSITTDENDCTNYVQSLDGRYGFRLKFAAPADNVCLRGEQVKILLDGRDPFARKRPDALHAARPEGREHRKGG